MARLWPLALLLLLLRQVHGFMVLPLELVNSSSSSSRIHRIVKRERELLGSARMGLHDDLLTKGYYTSRLVIGTPPKEFALIVDTGSTVTYVPCSSCTHCGRHQDPRFSPESSATYQPLGCGTECQTGFCDGNNRCKYERQYAEMSTSSGILGRDLFAFGNASDLQPQPLVFGCETVETGDLFYQTADGIMGLGRGSLSIIDQLVEHRSMENSFSLCYGGMDEGGGSMILGSFLPPAEMVFTETDPKRSPYYNLKLAEILVAGDRLPVDPEVFNKRYGTVLDSGTTYAYFPEPAFIAFVNAVEKHLKNVRKVAGPDPNFKDLCFEGAGTDLTKLSDYFPSVDFVFKDGKSVKLTAENYLFRHTKVSGAYCLGIFKNEKDPTTLLGGIIVRNMLVTYHRVNRTIGFWKTNCNDLWSRLPGKQHSAQPKQFFPPPALAPAPNEQPTSDDDTGAIEISMLLVGTNVTTFSISEFLDEMMRQLDARAGQVRVLNYTAAGSDTSVRWLYFPSIADNRQLHSAAQSIVARLEHHEVHLSEAFGGYNLTGWKVIPFASRSSVAVYIVVTVMASLLLLLVAAASLMMYRRRKNEHSYEAIDKANAAASMSVQMQQL